MKTLYDKFGFNVRLLERQHAKDVFVMLNNSKDKTYKEIDAYTRKEDRERLKSEIRRALDSFEFNSVGIFKDDELIGISFNSFDYEIRQPWFGQMYVKDEYRKTKAPLVLMNYILNHLYNGYTMRLRTSGSHAYNKHIRTLPIQLGYSIFNKDLNDRLKRACREE